MAESTSFSVQEGDVILLGTDGLFDNLSEDMILHHVSKLRVSMRPESRDEFIKKNVNASCVPQLCNELIFTWYFKFCNSSHLLNLFN